MADNLPLHASRTETLLIRQRLADTMTALGQGIRGLLPNLDGSIVDLELQHAAYYWAAGALEHEPVVRLELVEPEGLYLDAPEKTWEDLVERCKVGSGL